jgi:hypothetical protein
LPIYFSKGNIGSREMGKRGHEYHGIQTGRLAQREMRITGKEREEVHKQVPTWHRC